MINTVRLSVNYDLEKSEGILQMASFWVVIGLSGHFTVKVPKYRSDNKHSKSLAKNDDLEAFDS